MVFDAQFSVIEARMTVQLPCLCGAHGFFLVRSIDLIASL